MTMHFFGPNMQPNGHLVVARTSEGLTICYLYLLELIYQIGFDPTRALLHTCVLKYRSKWGVSCSLQG